MLQKIRDEFFGNSLTMIDFLGQFELMAKKYFEPDRIYDLNRLCLVKRRLLDGGEREVLQFLNDRLELIEEISLGKNTSEQLAVSEFLSIGTDQDKEGVPEVSPVMRQFFDRVISVSGSEGISKRAGGLSKILLDGETRTETYTDRPDIPLFEESEDGFQKVHPVSKAFKDDDEITVRTPFSEEPDLFSEIGMNPEREEEESKAGILKLDEEPEVLFTHSMIVVDDNEEEGEEEFTVFEGGLKVTPQNEEEPALPKDDELLEEFMETLVGNTQPAGEPFEEEPGFESETVPQEMAYSGDEVETGESPVYEPVSGSDHFEVVEEMTTAPEGPVAPEDDERAQDFGPEPMDEESTEEVPLPGIPDVEEPPLPGNIVEEEIDVTEIIAQEETPVEEDEPPHKKQRISIFDDLEDEEGIAPEPVIEIFPEETDGVPETLEFAAEEIFESGVQVEDVVSGDEETILITEDDLELAEVESVQEEGTSGEVIEAVESEPVDEAPIEVNPEPQVPMEVLEETRGELEEKGEFLFDEDFFDDVIEPEIPEERHETRDTTSNTGSTATGDEPKKSEPDDDSGEVFHHISRSSIIEETTASDIEPTAAVPEPIQFTESNEPETGITAGIKEEEKPMSSEETEEKSTYSVLLKMLLLLGLMVATWFILDSTGLLKGKPASLNNEDLAKGAVVITDSNSLADQREYPYNKDTQNDAILKGTIVKAGKYYEVAENGVLTPVEYDTSSKKQIKVTVPPDSLITKSTTKDKKGGKGKDSKEKEKEKATGAGNIALQDAVKNKVNEKKIADFVFKSGKKFYIQISALRSFETAEKVAKDLKKKGYNSFIMKVKKEGVRGEDGVWYRVRVGPYDKEEKALEVNKTLNKNKKS